MHTSPADEEESGPGGKPKKKTSAFNWLRRLLYGIVIFLVLAVGLLLAAGTGPVLRLAMPTAERAVSAAIEGRLAVGGIRGSLWTGLAIDSLTLAMPATGLEVEGNQLELQWSPLALLQGVVEIDRLAAASLAVTLPQEPGPEEQPDEPAEGPPALPLAIRLGRLDLPDVVVVDPQSGRRFSYAVEASGAVGKRAAELSLHLTPRAEDLDRLAVDLAFDADQKELRAEVDGRFHRTGIAMTLAGLPPEEAADVTLALKGEGPAEQWRGNLQLAASDLAELAGEIGLSLDRRQLGFTFSGTAGTLGKLSAELPAQLQGTVDLGLSGRYDMEAERLTLTTLDLAKPELLTLAAEADFDLAANRLAARLQARIDPAASSLTGDAAGWQGLDLQGEAQGNLAMPDLHLKVTGQSVTTPVLTTRELSLTVRTTARDDRLAVEVQGTAQGNDWTEAGLAAILGERLDLALKADLAEDFHDMTMEDVVIAAAGLQLTGRAGLDDNGAVTAAAVTADIADLAVFSALTGMELSGAGRLTVQNGAWDPAGGGRAEFEITAKELGLGQADLDRLAGPQPALAGHLELSPRQDLTVKLDRIDLAMTDGSLSLALTDGFARMAAAGELAVLPGALPPDIGVVMPQAARLAVQLDGPVGAPAGEIDLAVPTIESGERFDKIEIASTMEWSEEAVLSLLNRADFTLREKPYRLTADVVLPPDRLQLTGLTLKGDMLELAGGLELPGYEPPMRGTINLTRLDAAMLRDWAPPVAAGQVAGKIDFLPEEKKQRIAIDATARGLRLAGGSGADQNGLDRLTLRGHVADAFGEPAVELQLTGTKIAYGQATLDKLQAALRGPLSGLRATLSTAGQLQASQTHESLPVTLSATADMTLAEDVKVKVSRLTAGIGTEKIALRRPLQLNRTAAGAVDGTAALAIGAGGLDGTFSFIPDREISATAELSSIALGPWDEMFTRQGLTGILSLSANWNEQAGKAARAGLSASVGEIRLAQIARITEGGQTPPLALQLDANLNQGRLDGSLSAGGPELQILTARAGLPLVVSLLDGRFDLDPRAPLTVQADVDGEIAQFWPYVPLPDHSLSGRLKLAAVLSGSQAEPNLEGTVQLADGRYEHLQFGTLLQNIRLDGRLDPRGVHITEIAADDGGKGTLTGTAEIEIATHPPLAYRATLAMRDMAVTRMDELQLFGDIDLSLAGDDRKAAINGEVTVNRGEVDLAVALPPSVPQLEVDNLHQPGEPAGSEGRVEPKQEEPESFAAELQVTVEIPGRLFVRGKGLDSEWEGHLDITGPADSPKLVGQLQARRGQLEVIGTTFAIRDSKIIFLGGQPPDPQLDIVGVHTAGDLEVKANLSGTASKTKLTLSSEPQLPQEEILSRIVFGKSQGRLSPYEAVQLAGVAAELTGTTEGFDIMGTFRKILRVDVLRVEGGENGPSVEVGKYLTEGVYVGTKRGATSDTSGIEVEIELTPHLKATSESNEIDNKAGLQFKWDY